MKIDEFKLLALLSRLEFSKYRDGVLVCPNCGENFGKYGHSQDCELAQTIKQCGGEVKFQE